MSGPDERPGYFSAFLTPETSEARAEREAKEAAEKAEARDRWRLALAMAGVPVDLCAVVLAGLEAEGFTPAVRTEHGVLQGGLLVVEHGNPNSVKHERLVLTQSWQPVETPPDPPWVYCPFSIEHNIVPGLERCSDPEHGEHTHTLAYGSMHRLRRQETTDE